MQSLSHWDHIPHIPERVRNAPDAHHLALYCGSRASKSVKDGAGRRRSVKNRTPKGKVTGSHEKTRSCGHALRVTVLLIHVVFEGQRLAGGQKRHGKRPFPENHRPLANSHRYYGVSEVSPSHFTVVLEETPTLIEAVAVLFFLDICLSRLTPRHHIA